MTSALDRNVARIRPASAGDWAAIEKLLTTAALPLDGAREHLEDFLLADHDGMLVGCAAVERYGHAGLLRSVAVAESVRGTGIGAALVERSLADARAAGLSTVVLLTTTAERFFPRFGFEVVDRAAVPDVLRESAEFRGACPASATVMRLTLAPQGVVVRPARHGDAAAIAAIYNEGIRARTSTFETRERTVAQVEDWFGRGERYPILVAERAERVVGWISASSYRPREHYHGVAEFSVYVASAERGRRIGDGLMRDLLVALERAGFWKVVARVFPENTVSRALCRRHGFREVGTYERHARLDGRWRDVVIVERLLGAART
jgi:phosphinothricin acetyltransferase